MDRKPLHDKIPLKIVHWYISYGVNNKESPKFLSILETEKFRRKSNFFNKKDHIMYNFVGVIKVIFLWRHCISYLWSQEREQNVYYLRLKVRLAIDTSSCTWNDKDCTEMPVQCIHYSPEFFEVPFSFPAWH